MSPRPPERRPPASMRPRRRIRARHVILAGVAQLILLASFEVGILQVPPDTVQTRVCNVNTCPPVASGTITDARTVADLYRRINSLPTVWYSALYDQCPAPQSDVAQSHFVYYQIDFMRWGLLIEGVALFGKGCTVWDVVRGGILVSHNDPGGQTQVILSEARLL